MESGIRIGVGTTPMGRERAGLTNQQTRGNGPSIAGGTERPDPADVIAIGAQPRPENVSVNHIEVAGRIVSAIHRDWRDGDSGRDGACTRCPECLARPDGACHFQVEMFIPEDRAWDFGLKELARPVARTPGKPRSDPGEAG